MITSEKLVGSENYLSWSVFVELWFMGQGYEDHLVTQETDIPEVTSSIVNVRQQDMDLSTYIGQIASLKEEFLIVMPLTTDVGDQRTQIDKFFMVLTLIGLRPNLESIHDQILGSSSVPPLDDVFARLLRISSTQTFPSDNTSDSSVLVSQTNSRGGRSGNRGRGQRPHCTYCNKLGHTRDRCYQLHRRPPCTAHVAQSSDPQPPQPPIPPHLRDLFSSITTTSALPTVTLANGSQTMAKGPEYGVDDWHRTRLGHPSLSKFQKTVPRFLSLSSLACEFCQLGKHTRVSFPKRLNNRAKSLFELVHTFRLKLGETQNKSVNTPMDPNVKLIPRQREPLGDPWRYRRLVGKLNYLTITRLDISFPAKVWCTRTEVIPRLLVTQMQIGLAHPQIDVPLPGIDRVLKPSIELWLWQHVNSYG
ncbi:hypothetical protein CK203_050566 [Vitis vinifera]|uniref:GAG-pre-integrase domain-containing protein n=1 Tax=Vitis vinifera TaxID=29760 RepID=A0A438GFJ2_VITVI|nr:hypothetical protein CK203_050566 [Vitis vinifera]